MQWSAGGVRDREAGDASWRVAAALLLSLAATAAVYGRLITVYFHQDDFLNLYDIVNQPALAFVTRMHGGHLLLVRNLIFWTLERLVGPVPEPYMWTMLVTHLVNVLLLFLIVQSLTGRPWLACFGATLWGVSPVNEGALGWYSVYGQVLVTTCVLVVLLGLSRRRDGGSVSPRLLALWAALLVAASASFGVGIGMTLVMPAVAFLFLPQGSERRRAVACLTGVAVAVVALYLTMHRLHESAHAGLATVGALRMVLRRWTSFLQFWAHLVAYGLTSLAVGPVFRPTQYPGPVAVVAIVGVGGTALLGWWRAERAVRCRVAACVLLVLGAYGMIAAGRVYATGNMTWLVRAARFHYAAPAPLIIAFCLALAAVDDGRWLGARTRAALLAMWFAIASAGYLAFGSRVNAFSDARNQTAAVLAAIDAAVRAAPPGADVFLPIHKFPPVGWMMSRSLRAFPGTAAVFAIFHADDVVDGRRVHFVAPDAEVYQATRNGRRSAALVVGPEYAARLPGGSR